MTEDQLTPQQLFELDRFADALNTLATALGQLVADELLTLPEARGVLVRAGILTLGMIDEQQQST